MSFEHPSDAREQHSNAWSQAAEQARETYATKAAAEFSRILGSKEEQPPEMQAAITDIEHGIVTDEIDPDSAVWRSLLHHTSPGAVQAFGPNPVLSLFSTEIQEAVAEDHARAHAAVEERRA